MGRNQSPTGSSLSSVDSSDDFDEEGHDYEEALPRPSKRQKLGAGSTASSAAVHDPEPDPEVEPDPLDGMSDVSEDTEGDIPNSPVNARMDEDDFQEQVTECAWDGCNAGDLGNMDRLVEHIHNDHIESRQKKYTCEWNNCNRKGMPHASGYALKAHMRSHTREKPFYCYLPECDRAFTRSDALAKHMRTVHETEALRPSDPVPKSMQLTSLTGKAGRLKIIIKTPQSHAAGQDDSVEDGSNPDEIGADYLTPMNEEQGFSAEELSMPLEKLYRLCRAEVKWCETEGENLLKQCKEWEDKYKEELMEKNSLLTQVIDSEADWHKRRQAILSGAADVKLPLVKSEKSVQAERPNGTHADAAPPAVNGKGPTMVEMAG